MRTIHTRQLTRIHTRHLKIQHVRKVNNTKVRKYCIQFPVFFPTHISLTLSPHPFTSHHFTTHINLSHKVSFLPPSLHFTLLHVTSLHFLLYRKRGGPQGSSGFVWGWNFLTFSLSILIKIRIDGTLCRYLYLQNHSTCFGCHSTHHQEYIKTVTAASGTGHNTGTATSLQRVPIGPRWREVAVPILWPVPEAAVTVFMYSWWWVLWHPKHVEWFCRI